MEKDHRILMIKQKYLEEHSDWSCEESDMDNDTKGRINSIRIETVQGRPEVKTTKPQRRTYEP